ncbi:MAG: hypothetical protein R3B59_00385 [Dehalococcoidia bacterium]
MPRLRFAPIAAAVALPLLLLAAACGNHDPSEDALPPLPSPTPAGLDPATFVATVDNPYWPMTPGSRWVYRETDADGAEQRVEVTVTEDTRFILGITATVVHDIVLAEDGAVIEDTYDWYAQDRDGNVWYLGEDTKEYEDGKVVSTEGSWEAGVDGAIPGIVMFATPRLDDVYRQEYYAGHAEDAAKVLSLTARAAVPYGSFDAVLQTWDFTPLDLEAHEHKHYARGVGLVLVTDPDGTVREELLTYTPAP